MLQMYLITNTCFRCNSSSHVSDAAAHCQDGCPCQAYAHRPCHFHLCEGNNTKYFLPLCLTYVTLCQDIYKTVNFKTAYSVEEKESILQKLNKLSEADLHSYIRWHQRVESD